MLRLLEVLGLPEVLGVLGLLEVLGGKSVDKPARLLQFADE